MIGTVIKPIIHGVFAKKFYGGLLNYAADPILGGVDKWLTSIVAVMEKRFAHTSPTKSKAIASGDENQKARAENLYLTQCFTLLHSVSHLFYNL